VLDLELVTHALTFAVPLLISGVAFGKSPGIPSLCCPTD
jgi:hypothetical protein